MRIMFSDVQRFYLNSIELNPQEIKELNTTPSDVFVKNVYFGKDEKQTPTSPPEEPKTRAQIVAEMIAAGDITEAEGAEALRRDPG